MKNDSWLSDSLAFQYTISMFAYERDGRNNLTFVWHVNRDRVYIEE